MPDNKHDLQANTIISIIMISLLILFYFLNDLKEYIKINKIESNIKNNYSLVSTNDNFSKTYITYNGLPSGLCSSTINIDKNKIIELLNELNHEELIIQYDNKLYISNYAKERVDKATIMTYINNCINESVKISILEKQRKDSNLLSWNNFDGSVRK